MTGAIARFSATAFTATTTTTIATITAAAAAAATRGCNLLEHLFQVLKGEREARHQQLQIKVIHVDRRQPLGMADKKKIIIIKVFA